MRALLAGGVAAALLIVAACESFDDASDVPSSDDAGTDATSDAGGDASIADASATDGALADAEAGIPPGMVLVTAGTPFYIDAREVTYGEFSDFKDKVLANGDDAGFPPVCAFKAGVLGPGNCTHATRDIPVRCVDWCDAYAYCAAAGKRLCGRIGGTGSVGAGNDDLDPFLGEWVRACAGGTSTTDRWPYGITADASTCNTEEQAGAEPSDAGGYPGCVGGVPGLFDMSGNVAEIDDSCSGDAGHDDQCRVHGGSFYDGVYSCKCNSAPVRARGDQADNHGFRCCKTP